MSQPEQMFNFSFLLLINVTLKQLPLPTNSYKYLLHSFGFIAICIPNVDTFYIFVKKILRPSKVIENQGYASTNSCVKQKEKKMWNE